MKILIFGLPGSGKTTLAKPLCDLLSAVHLNGDDVRRHYEGHDMSKWDFTYEGRIHQASRMGMIADGIVRTGKICVADFVCPTQELRDIFKPDFTVWMNTIPESQYADTNALFEPPTDHRYGIDYHVSKWFDDTHAQLVPVVERFMKKQQETQVGYHAWRLEKNV